jgi:hypothetical protein
MEELVALVSKKTGLNKDQATAAVNVVVDFIKKKLPAPVAAQVDAVLSGKGALGSIAGALDDGKLDANDAVNLFQDLMGGKKNK